jgi:lysophospholipase L1-like esterase
MSNRNLLFVSAILAALFIFNRQCDAGEEPMAVAPKAKDDGEWKQKHASYVAAAKNGGIPLLFIGDSITEYWGTTGKDVWEKTYAPQHAANFGIAADKVENVLWRVKNGEFEGITPKVVVLLVGINNTWGTRPAERERKGKEIAAGVKQIIDTIREKSPQTKVLLLAIFATEEGIDPPVRIANELMSKYDDGKNIRYLDINSKLAGADGKVTREVLADGLHPSAKGYQIWADAIAPLLKDMMGK